MKLYDENGELDLDIARAELVASARINDRNTRRDDLAALQTAALLDIAESLRPLALQALYAMQPMRWTSADIDTGPSAQTAADELAELHERADALLSGMKGTRVRSTVGDDAVGTLTGEHGMDQGEVWVGVHWDGLGYDEGSGGAERIYVSNLEPIESEASEDGIEFVTPEDEAGYELGANTVADVDDLDADFDGDRHPEALDAVAALKARQKAAKKGKK